MIDHDAPASDSETPATAKLTTKQLVSIIKRRQHGTELLTVDEVDRTIKTLDLAQLADLMHRVTSLFEYKQSLLRGLTDAEKGLLAARDFMGCIRSVRERTGLSITDAKAFMDRHKTGTP